MHFLKGNGLLNFASRGDLKFHRGRRGKFDSRMMHGSRVYHPKFAPFAPRTDPTLMHTSIATAVAATITSASSTLVPAIARRSLFHFAPRHSGVHLVHLRFVLELPRRGFTVPRPRRRRLKLRRCRCCCRRRCRRLYPQGILLLRIKALYAQKRRTKFACTSNYSKSYDILVLLTLSNYPN